MIDLISLRKLDPVSIHEIEKIIEHYDNLKMAIVRKINRQKLNLSDPATYDLLIEKYRKNSLNPSNGKKIAILRQMKNENCKELKNEVCEKENSKAK